MSPKKGYEIGGHMWSGKIIIQSDMLLDEKVQKLSSLRTRISTLEDLLLYLKGGNGSFELRYIENGHPYPKKELWIGTEKEKSDLLPLLQNWYETKKNEYQDLLNSEVNNTPDDNPSIKSFI